jgi:tetratricopeptide (TPR) repeat protein
MLLLFNVGDTDLALRVTRWARDVYSKCGDTVGIGKTLVDEGVIYASSGVFERSIAVYESALELLGDRSPEHRFGAFQGTAVAYANLGNIRRANDFLDQAATAWSGQKSSKMYASLLFLKGEIALLLDQLAQASQYFLRARNRCLELGLALEYVLVSLRIAKVYFRQGDRGRLSRVLKEILFQQREVERSNKVLGRTLGEFLAESAREHVTAEILDETYSKLREGAQVAPPLFSPKNSP